MVAQIIDTHQAIEHLMKNKSFTKKQAQQVVEVITDIGDGVATKSDLENSLQVLEYKLTNKMYIMAFAILGGMFAMLKIFLG